MLSDISGFDIGVASFQGSRFDCGAVLAYAHTYILYVPVCRLALMMIQEVA